MPSKPTSLTAAPVCHELLLCVRILVDQVVKSGAVMLSVFMIYFPRLTLASILVARREAGTRVFLCVIVPLKKIPVFFVDTRSPSPRLYRLITHKFKVTRSLTSSVKTRGTDPPRCALHTIKPHKTEPARGTAPKMASSAGHV